MASIQHGGDLHLRVLLIEDDVLLRDSLLGYLRKHGHEVLAFDSVEAFEAAKLSSTIDVALVDVRLPGKSGIELISAVREGHNAPVIIITGHGNVPLAVEAMRKGAHEFLTKPVAPASVLSLLERAVEHRRLHEDNVRLRSRLRRRGGEGRLIATAPNMLRLLDRARRVAATESSVLILGETGTGKELVARLLHSNGPAPDGPFIAVNCATLNSELAESTIFGHERGAFTGAVDHRRGILERANGGTLFLDEIGAMPLEVQAKFLRVLETRTFCRLASEEQRHSSFRLVTAAPSSLPSDLQQKGFREDLYFRIATVELHIPPLRDRREDIPHLAQHFLVESQESVRRSVEGFTQGALRRLDGLDWPGNVRQLRSIVERATIFAQGSRIDEADVAEALTFGTLPKTSAPSSPACSAGEDGRCRLAFDPCELADYEGTRARLLRDIDHAFFSQLLSEVRGNLTEAARHSGVSYRTLLRRLKELELRRADYLGVPTVD